MMRFEFIRKVGLVWLACLLIWCPVVANASTSDIVPYAYASATKTKKCSKRIPVKIEDHDIDAYITIAFDLKGWYTYDKASGEIKSGYKTEATNIRITSATDSELKDALKISMSAVSYDNPSVATDGSKVTFRVTFVPKITLTTISIPFTYELDSVTDTLVVYAS